LKITDVGGCVDYSEVVVLPFDDTPCVTPTPTPSVNYCYSDGNVVYGPFLSLQECQNAAGSYICNQCVGEPEP
jgi:hypothetical protein